jgi:hypothetical protein
MPKPSLTVPPETPSRRPSRTGRLLEAVLVET